MLKLYITLFISIFFQSLFAQNISLNEIKKLRFKSIGTVQEELFEKDFRLLRTSTALFDNVDSVFFQYGDSDFIIAHAKAKKPKKNVVFVELSDKTLFQKLESELKNSEYVSSGSGVRSNNGIQKIYKNKLEKEQVVVSVRTTEPRISTEKPKTIYRFTFQKLRRSFLPN